MCDFALLLYRHLNLLKNDLDTQIIMMMSGMMPIAYGTSLKQPHLVLEMPFLQCNCQKVSPFRAPTVKHSSQL